MKPIDYCDKVIFGGTFDPPHSGHLDCLKAVEKNSQIRTFVVVPVGEPVTFQGKTKEPWFSFEDRFEMCKTLFRKCFQTEKAIVISDVENHLPKPSYTRETIRHLLKESPKDRWAFLLGADQFASFMDWQGWQEILQEVSLLVVRRGSPEGSYDITQTVENLSRMSKFNYQLKEPGLFYCSKNQKYIQALDVKTCEAESSKIRLLWEKGESIPEDWLPQELEYFLDKKK